MLRIMLVNIYKAIFFVVSPFSALSLYPLCWHRERLQLYNYNIFEDEEGEKICAIMRLSGIKSRHKYDYAFLYFQQKEFMFIEIAIKNGYIDVYLPCCAWTFDDTFSCFCHFQYFIFFILSRRFQKTFWNLELLLLFNHFWDVSVHYSLIH